MPLTGTSAALTWRADVGSLKEKPGLAAAPSLPTPEKPPTQLRAMFDPQVPHTICSELAIFQNIY
jgi:hypothetical protein